MRGEGAAERVDRPAVAAFREVRDGLERQHRTTLRAVRAYYDARAPEYDEWYLGIGKFAERDRPDWELETAELTGVLERLPAARTLDVACGTGFLTRHLRGEVTGVDQSARMLEIAAQRVPDARFVQGDALELPFEDGEFDRLFTGHFYGHLDENERARFLSEARRVASELVVVDSAGRPDTQDGIQERVLNDGSRWEVLKRYFTPE
jgi:ubiquinone/menaquinone biosynthesis C-methylase UbiE